ncbi:MAG: hypothetical protein JWP91_2151 [Fibrobacteres bacterium]|nr:hypothetical protein [Fibrobacterota bacterium]
MGPEIQTAMKEMERSSSTFYGRGTGLQGAPNERLTLVDALLSVEFAKRTP